MKLGAKSVKEYIGTLKGNRKEAIILKKCSRKRSIKLENIKIGAKK